MTLEAHAPSIVTLCGIYNLGFAAFHLFFWRIFRWPNSLEPSGEVNVAITQTLNIVLTYCFLAYGGWLVWAGIEAALPPSLALIAGGGFWLLRTVLQPALFSVRHKTSAWITVVFAAGVGIHAIAAFLVTG